MRVKIEKNNIVFEDNSFKDKEDNLIKIVVKELQDRFHASIIQTLADFDDVYVDISIEGKIVYVSYNVYLGVSIKCEDPELREQLFTYFKYLGEVAA